MLTYPVRLVRKPDGGVRALFPDVPQAVAEGRDEADALHRAKFALELCLGHALQHGELPPPPSARESGPAITTLKFSRARAAAGGGRY